MPITTHKVVTIDYSLTNEEGQILDSTKGKEPLSYLHGMENFIPGLEEVLEGKSVGDHITTTLSPEDGYGQRDESLVKRVPRNTFEEVDELKPGMQFQTEIESEPVILTVVEIVGDEVTVDGNHPLVGRTLHFDVTVLGVRDATENELQQGDIEGSGSQINKIRPGLSLH